MGRHSTRRLFIDGGWFNDAVIDRELSFEKSENLSDGGRLLASPLVREFGSGEC
jgi:hypothetical protein